ncbi:MAG: phospholipid carrier-dependent glycosyltransferase, partial [Patescibacteria group bacterium]
MKKKSILLAILICVLFFILANASVYKDAPTSDEMSHIPVGYYYLQTGRYFINPEHPPLTKDLAALPLALLQPEFPEVPENEIHNPQWEWGKIFLFDENNDPWQLTFWARFSVIFFNSLLLFILFLSVRKAWNEKAALISIFLIATSAFSLAHASLVTLDFMPTMFFVIGFVWFSIYMQQKKISSFLLTCAFLAAALLSKFSFALFIPVAFLAGLIYVIFIHRKWKQTGLYIVKFALLSFIIFLAIGIFYAPHVFNMETDLMVTQIDNTYPDGWPQIGQDVMDLLAKTNNPFLKGIAEYGVGVVMVFSRIAGAWQTIYFMGGVYGSEGAGLLYFPLLFVTKLSIPVLALTLLALILASFNIIKNNLPNGQAGKKLKFKVSHFNRQIINYAKNPLSFFLLFSILIYGLITAFSSFQIGLRHIFPIVMATFLLVAKVIAD